MTPCPHTPRRYFNPPAPLRGGTLRFFQCLDKPHISIHPPLVGRDVAASVTPSPMPGFQSTRPLRGRTVGAKHRQRVAAISIHPPLAGRDAVAAVHGGYGHGISIHPPLAGRDTLRIAGFRLLAQFQSTRSLRGGTLECKTTTALDAIFQSPRPLRGGTAADDRLPRHCVISIHPPLAGRDVQRITNANIEQISIHPLLAGRDCISTKRADRHPRRPADTGPAGYRQKAKCWRPERGR